MNPLILPLGTPSQEPNLELLRNQGWRIGTCKGNYCVAWKDHTEVLLVWREDSWQVLQGRGDFLR